MFKCYQAGVIVMGHYEEYLVTGSLSRCCHEQESVSLRSRDQTKSTQLSKTLLGGRALLEHLQVKINDVLFIPFYGLLDTETGPCFLRILHVTSSQ